MCRYVDVFVFVNKYLIRRYGRWNFPFLLTRHAYINNDIVLLNVSNLKHTSISCFYLISVGDGSANLKIENEKEAKALKTYYFRLRSLAFKCKLPTPTSKRSVQNVPESQVRGNAYAAIYIRATEYRIRSYRAAVAEIPWCWQILTFVEYQLKLLRSPRRIDYVFYGCVNVLLRNANFLPSQLSYFEFPIRKRSPDKSFFVSQSSTFYHIRPPVPGVLLLVCNWKHSYIRPKLGRMQNYG